MRNIPLEPASGGASSRWHAGCWSPSLVTLAPTHLKRYKDIAVLLWKHGHGDLLRQAELDPPTDSDDQKTSKGDELARDLEKLGPTFVKIGQLLSTRSDLLPESYLLALSRLQDEVEPLPLEDITQVIQNQLGVRVSKAFETFESKPLGSASLGQVHLATLHGGQQVAVKVQRPDIRETIVEDLASIGEIAEFLDAHTAFGKRYETSRILEQFRTTLMRELDYQKEAAHLEELRENLAEFRHLRVPRVIRDYSTSQVLTMEYLAGTKITALSGAALLDVDGEQLADELFKAYLKQVLVDGFFHADPHPGNLLLTHDKHIAILDLGMIGRLNQRVRDQLLHLLAGIAEGDGYQTAEAAIRLGEARGEAIDRNLFSNAVEQIVGASKRQDLASIQIGALVLQVMEACADAGLRIPAEISLLGKTLMNLDKIGSTLAPNFDPSKAMRRHLNEIATSRLSHTLSNANILGTVTEAKEFLGHLPSRMNRILELIADNKLGLKVDALDETRFLQGLQKVANRITMGLILAAFIVGSALLARVETNYRLLGYPGLAMIFFLIAVIGAGLLMTQIMFKDD